MKKRLGVSQTDYEWLQYNALVEISHKLTRVINSLNNREEKDQPHRECDKCKGIMVWAILSNKWICVQCGNVITVDDILESV